MSKFAIDEDEMDDLGKGLDSLSEVYDDVETPCPVPAFGHPSLDEAYREFADCIPEFPRRSPGIFTLHDKLFSMKAIRGRASSNCPNPRFFAPGLGINRPTPSRIFAIPTEE